MTKIVFPQIFANAALAAIALTTAGLCSQVLAAPFQLNAETGHFIENPPPMNATYPAPTTVTPTYSGEAATYGNNSYGGALQGGANQQGQSRPLQAQVQRSVALPPAFMGTWTVSGKCSGMEAQPAFQASLSSIFAASTQNTWTISGNAQQGYQMSNDQGVQTALAIYKVSKNTAMIRYQHPIGKTMAQEAIVMELQNGGATFQGLERISIIKDGQQPPRAKVTYQLFGQRQR
jgi:hypothetical protein